MAQQLDNADNIIDDVQSPKANIQTLKKRRDFILASRALRHSCKTMIVQLNQNDLRAIRLGICLLYTSPSPRDQRGSRIAS